MSGSRVLEEDVDHELLLSKLQGRGTAFEHLNLSYLSLGDRVLARAAAVMRQSSAFANIKQIWLGSNQLSSIGNLPLPSCLKGIWLFSNRLNSLAALDVLQRICRFCPEIQFVHLENNAFVPEDIIALLASRGYANLPPQLLPSCRSNSIGEAGDYVQFVLFMRQDGSPLTRRQEAERQYRVLSKAHGSGAQLNCSKILYPQRCSLLLSKVSLGSLRVVDFSCNGLSSQDVADIAPAFQRMTALHTIDFSYNNIVVLPLSLLENAAHVQNVATTANPICLPPIEICNSGWQRVLDYRFSFRRMRELSLRGCSLTQADAAALCPWLAQAANLQSLDISGNPDVCNAGLYLLLDALLPCSNVLTAITVAACGLDSEFDPSVLRSYAKLRRVSFSGNRCMSNPGVRRVLTALLSPPFNPKLMTIDVSACGLGFVFASHIQRLLRLAALDLSDNNFMLPPAKTVAEGLLAVQKYLHDPPVAASRALESCLAQQAADVAMSAAAAVVDLIAWQTATTSSVSPGLGLMWCTLLKSSKIQRDRFQTTIDNALLSLRNFVPLLSRCRDEEGEDALSVCSIKAHAAFSLNMRFLGRYEFKVGSWGGGQTCEQESGKTIVLLAQDTSDGGKPVAFKFFRDESQFAREIEARTWLSSTLVYATTGADTCVAPLLAAYSAAKDEVFAAALQQQPQLQAYGNCIVMPAADRSLLEVLEKEGQMLRLEASQDGIRAIARSVATCLGCFHACNIVHGDVKPRNVVRIGGSFVFVDLDAVASVGSDSIAGLALAKYSSAFLPPEAVVRLEDGTCIVRGFIEDLASGVAVPLFNLSYSLLKADPSHDIYHVVTGATLWHCDREEQLVDEGDLLALGEWRDETKASKLRRISPSFPLLVDLISCLLNRNPKHRPRTAAHVLAHPFISQQPQPRLLSQPAQFHVFISHSAAAQSIGQQLLEYLSSLGFACACGFTLLSEGNRQAATAALMSCSVFACIVSGSDFGADELQGECTENLLLLSLALELHDRGFIPRIFPMLVYDGTSMDEVAAQYDADAEVVNAATAQLLQANSLADPHFSLSGREVVAAILAHDGAVILDSGEEEVIAVAAAEGCEYVRAAFDYGGAEGHLAFSVGDRVRVVQKHNSGWYMGELNGNFGLFPANYTEEEPDQAQPEAHELQQRESHPHLDAAAAAPMHGGSSVLHPQLRSAAQQLAAAISNVSKYVQTSRITAAAAAPVVVPPVLEMTTYTIKVVTGSAVGAGTDANVFCTLFGSDGSSSGEFPLLKSAENRDKFERGRTDSFEHKALQLPGGVCSVGVRFDASGLGSDWQLQSVSVSEGSGAAREFACGEWLNSSVKSVRLQLAKVEEENAGKA